MSFWPKQDTRQLVDTEKILNKVLARIEHRRYGQSATHTDLPPADPGLPVRSAEFPIETGAQPPGAIASL